MKITIEIPDADKAALLRLIATLQAALQPQQPAQAPALKTHELF